ncbi:MAG: tetratricopeptide repeat protein [Reyranellaceae bacterium]
MALARSIVVAMLCAATAQAQTRDETVARCRGADPDAAIAACTALIDSSRESGNDLADAFDARGTAFAARGTLARAIADFDQAMRLNPSHPTAFVHRGTVYFRQGVYHQSMQDARSALRINPSDVDALRLRALSLARTHQHALAIQDYDRALRLKDSAEIRQLRCESLKAMGPTSGC